MVQEYEDNIIPPPPQFRDGYKLIPKPRTIKNVLLFYFTLLYLLTSSFTTALALLYFILHTSSCSKNKNRRKNQSVIRIHKIIWSNHSDSIKQYWKKKSHCIQTKTGDASDERSEFCWNTEHHMRKDVDRQSGVDEDQ